MAVALSPIGGAGAQFFNNNGVPLSGGKLYTYEAGTTTPATTYTSLSGTVAHTNPIILDSAGRVPGGEIWLTLPDSYKFVLKTSTDVLLGTWDNIQGYSSGSLAYAATEVQTATANQTLFVLTEMFYNPGTNTLAVYVDGVNQVVNNSYVESTSTSVTFMAGLHVGALVKFVNVNVASADASAVTYEPGFTGSVATTVEAKLQQTISVKDFGAVGDGVTDDTAAIQAAIDYAYTLVITQTVFPEYGWQSRGGTTVYLPAGKYLTTASITLRPNVSIKGEGKSSSAIYSTYNGKIITVAQATKSGEYNQAGITIQDLMIIGNRASTSVQTGIDLLRPVGMKIIGVVINSCSGDGMILREVSNGTFIDVEIANSGGCGLRLMDGTTGLPCNANTFISPRILYNDGDGIIIADESNGNTFIGGSVERNGYATSGVGFYNIKVTSASYQPNTFIDLWTEGPCEAHIYMNNPAGIGTRLQLINWRHFGDGAANYPNRALIVEAGLVDLTQPTASSVSYKVIAGSNAPFRLNKAGGAAIIYLKDASGATITAANGWIEDENGNTTNLAGLAFQRNVGNILGTQVFYQAGSSTVGVAYQKDSQTYPWYQSRTSTTDILMGNGTVAPDAGIRRVTVGQIGPRSGDFFNVGSVWNGSHLVMGAYRLWVDASNNLRIKNGVPASDTDGTVVGTQT